MFMRKETFKMDVMTTKFQRITYLWKRVRLHLIKIRTLSYMTQG